MVRANWCSYLQIILNAFDEDEITFTFARNTYSADIKPIKWVEYYGRIEYASGEFGWLKKQKDAVKLRVSKEIPFDAEEQLKTYPIERAYLLGENTAWFLDSGEKEYSVEICHIKDGIPIIICRYTIDGADQGERASRATWVYLAMRKSLLWLMVVVCSISILLLSGIGFKDKPKYDDYRVAEGEMVNYAQMEKARKECVQRLLSSDPVASALFRVGEDKNISTEEEMRKKIIIQMIKDTISPPLEAER
jgi:hypothetical protein